MTTPIVPDEIAYPLAEDMEYAARHGNTTPMNIMWCMLHDIALAYEIRHELGVTYDNAHELNKSKLPSSDEAIASVRRRSVPASISLRGWK